MFHSGQNVIGLPDWFRSITDQGGRGVQLFFILSSLTLFLSLDHRSKLGDSSRDFYIRRFFRIAPMFYIGLLFYPFFMNLKDISIGNIFGTLSFIGNGFSPYWINSLVPGGWSITVEMTFYLFVPLLFRLIKDLKKSVLFLGASFIICMEIKVVLSRIHVINDPFTWKIYLYSWFPNQFPIFALGIILFFLI
ncbi:acyltransferase family protein [Paenibacillus antarcticus]|uniref:Acyltransferase 3 domain-containing protein n=1 Tax=Paenibacillus antarcticus TaxID=253703 RepID=A0A168R0N8_9BACL|nr:acyltransferase family protein [Paenibacillus antarcticus]OAB48438.1 hypothetical protein PBAT_02060 [Paenibacillus antarcticus]